MKLERPNNPKVEAWILAYAIVHRDPKSILLCNERDFSDKVNLHYFNAIKALVKENKKILIENIVGKLKELNYWRGDEDFCYLKELKTTVCFKENLNEMVNNLNVSTTARNFYDCVKNILIDYDNGFIKSYLDFINIGKEKVLEATKIKYLSVKDTLESDFDKFRYFLLYKKKPSLQTGMKRFDEMVKPRLGTFNVIAGRTGTGKTTLALNLMFKIAKHNKDIKSLFFSLEMTKNELFFRIASFLTQIEIYKFYNLDETKVDKLETYIKPYYESVSIYDDVFSFENIVEMIKAEADAGTNVFYIDYLGLAIQSSDKDKKVGLFNEATRILHNLSREYGITIFCLAQLNREAIRGDKPDLIHIRDSGSIEQDADQVYLLYPDDKKHTDIYDLKIAKNRHGCSGEIIKLKLDGPKATFSEFEGGV